MQCGRNVMAEFSSSNVDHTTDQILPVNFNQEYRVKLGRTFTFPKENAFHTIKYDFKPKSVDSSQPGRMKVSGDEVSVSLPVAQADDVVLFKGAKRTCTKECVLIINTVTGEAILEKISNTVQLKGVRDPSKKKKPRSVSPLQPSQPKPNKQLAAMETAPPVSSSLPKSSGNKKTKRPKKSDKEVKSHLPPPPLGPVANKSNKSSSSLLTLPDSLSPLRSNNPTPEPPNNTIEPTPPPPPVHVPPPPILMNASKKKKQSSPFNSTSSSSSSDSSSSGSSSESDNEFDFVTSTTTTTTSASNFPLPPPAQPMLSMPQFVHHQPNQQQQSTMGPSVTVHNAVVARGNNNNAVPSIGGTLSDASSSSSSSDGEEEESSSSSDSPQNAMPVQHSVPHSEVRQRSISVLKNDLEMSDSDSD